MPSGAANVEKSCEPPDRPNKRKSASRNAVPMCVATRYTQPASRAPASASSNTTRKNEASDMASHATRNNKPFRAVSTSAMLATSPL